MSIFDRFKRNRPEVKVFNPRERKSFPLYEMMPTFFGWTAKWSQYSTAQALDAYSKSVWLYDCLRLRSNNISGVPWIEQAKAGEDWEESKGPLADLIARPNPEIDWPTMMAYTMYWLDLTGDSYWSKVRDGGSQVREVWPLFPDSMEAVPGRNSMIDSWKYRKSGISKTLPAADIIHFKYVDPGSPYYGLSPLQSAARAIDTDMEAGNFQKIQLQNHGVPVGYFQAPADMTPDQYEQNMKWIQEQAGAEKSRLPWLGSMIYQSMGSTPKEMDFVESRKMTRVEICSAYDVPLPLVGVYDDATLANIQTARRIFWMEGLIPVLRKLEGQLNLQLASEFGPGVRLTYDLSGIEALQEDMGAKIIAAKELWSMGVPLDQVNTVMDIGLDTDVIEGADVGYLPSGLLPANFDAGDTEAGGKDAAAVTYGEGSDKPALPAAGSAPAPDAPVANTAMNGAQVTALQGIAQAVADGAMPAETALQLILVAFPTITPEQAQAIIRPMDGFEKTKPEPQAAPTFGGNPNPPKQPADDNPPSEET